MGLTLAIDPGLRGCGVACMDGSELAWAVYVKNRDLEGRGPQAWLEMAWSLEWVASGCYDHMVLEGQQVYTGSQGRKGDPADLIELAGVTGAIAGRFCDRLGKVTRAMPREWKGQVPKDVFTQRIKGRLEPFEIKRVKTVGAKDHNTWDAVGLGLWAVGRMSPKRVIAR